MLTRLTVVALLLTAAAVYASSRSWILTLLPIGCSLISGVWQFGAMALLQVKHPGCHWLSERLDPDTEQILTASGASVV